jgi:hypothetical protein
MSSLRHFLVVVCSAAVTGAPGCANLTGPRADIEVRPASYEFTIPQQGSARVDYSVRNTGRTAVALTSRCGDRLSPAVERRESGSWQQYLGGMCITSLEMSPVQLLAGGSRDERVLLGSAGTYRLVIGTEHGQVVSPAFVVREQ